MSRWILPEVELEDDGKYCDGCLAYNDLGTCQVTKKNLKLEYIEINYVGAIRPEWCPLVRKPSCETCGRYSKYLQECVRNNERVDSDWYCADFMERKE